MITAFQSNAFQNNAFQIVTVVAVTTTGGGIGHGGKDKRKSRKPGIAVITVDGQDYRVPVQDVPAFLARMREELKEPAAVEKVVQKKAKTKKAQPEPPQITVKSAPVEVINEIRIDVEKNNKILEALWSGLVAMYEREIEDEETVILMLIT